jgi:hypothetical protein
VIRIGDHHDVITACCQQLVGGGIERLERGVTGVLAHDRRFGHAAIGEVVGGCLGLGEAVAGLVAAGHHHDRRHAFVVQLDHVVEAGRQLR